MSVESQPLGHQGSHIRYISYKYSQFLKGELVSDYLTYGEGNGNPLQCSCLENPVDRGAWWAAIHSVAQSRTQLKQLSSSSSTYDSSLEATSLSCSGSIETRLIYILFDIFHKTMGSTQDQFYFTVCSYSHISPLSPHFTIHLFIQYIKISNTLGNGYIDR